MKERSTYYYKLKFEKKKAQFNKHLPLLPYFKDLIGDKQEVLIAELGAGPVNTIGNYWPGVQVKITASDIMWPVYKEWWDEEPLVPIELQDMEHLTYPDNSFDIVHCVNALDHTMNPHKAVEEMKMICKPGGVIYLRHASSQKKLFGGHHYHNIEDLHFEGFTTEVDTETRHKWITSTYGVH